ncbi:unnamed protein product [Schistosoma curassoni]|uniref:LAM_G_DOMAIN domain-containing protein n=1 Tax=Schistosoma curassoni TaxID=6186 RepID=A0A183JWP5_9TREM|nr:unnamed protein product [Schistosoma curassoni]
MLVGGLCSIRSNRHLQSIYLDGIRTPEIEISFSVGGSQQETLDPGFVLLGTRQQGVPVILRDSAYVNVTI